ncbi:chemotaxis protein MotB [Paracoccus sp. Z118]|uniref:flagellar motor protein MotB n=1 Tax=Paracoccus sp. Z118 TaxID=2851017 RepID=UPI001C2C288D|nr:flagellar motor protein MotB [Paracoccus sp. Z118]MBV0891972.1 chemotaxis protein MotB [Paracoccus sp. Z118]
MAAKGSTIIIRRGTEAPAAGHHGGAWKVAYADFVTAMMAFFLMMWLLNATTEKQKQGLADYFDPTIMQTPNGGTTGIDPGETDPTAEATAASGDFAEIARHVQDRLTGSGAESMQRVNLLRHVVTRMTDEGLVIELGDLAGAPLFVDDTAQPTQALADLARIVAQVLSHVRNDVAVSGHVRSFPEMMVVSPVWALSDARAHTVRGLLEGGGMDRGRIQRVTAHADHRHRNSNPLDPANNRIEVILLR